MTTQIYADRAEIAEIWDVEGRRYIDFAGGIAVVNTGHRHPRVVEAVNAQLDRSPIPVTVKKTTGSMRASLLVVRTQSKIERDGQLVELRSTHRN